MGIGTSFPGGFQEFMQEIESGGVGAMEMVSRDMKALGLYLSGSISFGVCPQSGKAVEYRERIHRLTPKQRDMYDRAAQPGKLCCATLAQRLKLRMVGHVRERSHLISFGAIISDSFGK